MSYQTIIKKIKDKNIKMLFDDKGEWTGRCEMPMDVKLVDNLPKPFLTLVEIGQMKTITEKIWNDNK